MRGLPTVVQNQQADFVLPELAQDELATLRVLEISIVFAKASAASARRRRRWPQPDPTRDLCRAPWPWNRLRSGRSRPAVCGWGE